MLDAHQIHPTKLNSIKEVGTYFVTPSNKLYYIDGVVGGRDGTYAIENCRTNQIILWSEELLIARRSRVIVPLEGGET